MKHESIGVTARLQYTSNIEVAKELSTRKKIKLYT